MRWSQPGENLLLGNERYMAQSSDLKVHLEECERNYLKDFYIHAGQVPQVLRQGPFNLIQFN